MEEADTSLVNIDGYELDGREIIEKAILVA